MAAAAWSPADIALLDAGIPQPTHGIKRRAQLNSKSHLLHILGSFLQWTLLDLFEKAEQPELVRVGVVWQVDWAADAPFVRIAPGGEAWVPQVSEGCGQ